MAKKKSSHIYYDPSHPYLKTLRITKRSKADVAKKTTLRVLVVLVFFAVEAVLMWSFAEAQISYSPVQSEIVTGVRPPKAEAKEGVPVAKETPPPPKPEAAAMYLVIPKLYVNAPVESVGVTANGDMATSSSLSKVAWYKDGTKPGAVGNSVFAGHFGGPTENGIFRQLTKLQNDDIIEVRQADGTVFKYKVYKVQGYQVKEVPLQELFGKTDKAHLNLVTCFGNWNPSNWTYDQRLIVYTELIQ